MGHETDFTICDFVADVRAPTPSAAAELLSPDGADFDALFVHYASELQKQLRNLLAGYRNSLLNFAKRLRHPSHVLREQQQKLDHLEWRLLERTNTRLKQNRLKLAHLMALLDSVSPLNTLKRGYAIATDADGNNLTRASQTLKDARVIVQLFEGQLDCRVERLIDGAIPFFDKDQ